VELEEQLVDPVRQGLQPAILAIEWRDGRQRGDGLPADGGKPAVRLRRQGEQGRGSAEPEPRNEPALGGNADMGRQWVDGGWVLASDKPREAGYVGMGG